MRHQQKAIAIVLIRALNRHAFDMGGYTGKLNALDMELTRSWRMYSIWGWLRSYKDSQAHEPCFGGNLSLAQDI